MPGRKIPLITGEYYHIFNRGVARAPTFTDIRSYRRALNLMYFYQCVQKPGKYSEFLKLNITTRKDVFNRINNEHNYYIDLISYCFMPNHFHFLIKQSQNSGISRFIGDFTNSYTRYFNIKNDRVGPLFQGKFKSVHIESEEQLLHVSRYIHLNPYTSSLVSTREEAINYEFSSAKLYSRPEIKSSVDTNTILSCFKSKAKYKDFILNNADYQKSLKNIEHLLHE